MNTLKNNLDKSMMTSVFAIGAILKERVTKIPHKRVLSTVLCVAMLLSIMPLSVFAASVGYSVTIDGGTHGKVSYNGETRDSITVNVAKGAKLPAGIEILPDDHWVVDGFTFPAKVVQAAAGEGHSAVLTEDGELYTSGRNNYGQLGFGDLVDRTNFGRVSICPWETADEKIRSVVCSDLTTLVLTENGNVYFAGHKMGSVTDKSGIFEKLAVPNNKAIISLTAGNGKNTGNGHAIAIASDGTVYGIGENSAGQLGIGNIYDEKVFTAVTTKPWGTDTPILAAGGEVHSVIVTKSGAVYVSGTNDDGVLGIGDSSNSTRYTTFTKVGAAALNGKKIVAASSMYYNTLLADEEGNLYVAGQNKYGELGLGNTTTQRSFVQVSDAPWGADRVDMLSSGENHSFVLTETGRLFTAGRNYYGELGIGTSGTGKGKNTFFEVTNLYGKAVSGIWANKNHTIAVMRDGTAAATGYNNYGQLGFGDKNNRNLLSNVTLTTNTLSSSSLDDIAIIGDMTITAQYTEAHMVMVDSGEHGMVSYNGETRDSFTFNLPKSETKLPDGIEIIPNEGYEFKNFTFPVKAVQAAAGFSHTLVLTENGSLYSAGNNQNGQLGLGDTNNRSIFTQVTDCPWGDDGIKSVVCMNLSSFVLTNSGKIYSTGNSRIGKNSETNKFTALTLPENKTITAISSGESHIFALTSDGSVYSAGFNNRGQLGLGDKNSRTNFTKVTIPSDSAVIAAAVSRTHSLLLTENGKVYVAGGNYYGKLGLGDSDNNADYTDFTLVNGVSEKTITAVAAGDMHSFLMDSDGNLYAAGENKGKLGLGDYTERRTFTEVTNTPWDTGKVISIKGGVFHTVVLTESGSVYIAGMNNYGQLGFGDADSRTIFTEVPDFDGKVATDIATMLYYTIVVTQDGLVYGTGDNGSGQLGIGNTDGRNMFTKSLFTSSSLSDIFVAGDMTITAHYEKQTFTVTVDGGEHGKVKKSGSNLGESHDFTVAWGDTLPADVGVEANAGFTVSGYTVSGDPKVYYNLTDIIVKSTVTVTVKYKHVPTLTLTVTPTTADYPGEFLMEAVLTGADTIAGKTVDFYIGLTRVGSTQTDENGKASCEMTPQAEIPVGSYIFSAKFVEDEYNVAADSEGSQVTVNPGTQVPLVLNGVPASKTYGDEPFTVSVSGGSGNGAVTYSTSDELVATVDNNGLVTIRKAGNFTVTVEKATDGNYKAASVTSTEITVSRKTLTVDGLTATSRDYDGEIEVALTGGSLQGVVSGDVVTVDMPAKGAMADKKVGDNKSVTVPKIILTGSDADNYTLVQPTVTVNITPKEVSIIDIAVKDKVYDGKTAAEIKSAGSISGKIGGDSLDIVAGSCVFDSANANGSISVTASGFALSGTDAENYNLTAQPVVANASIDRKELIVSVKSVYIKCGQVIPTLTVRIAGFENGETADTVLGFAEPTALPDGSYDTTDTDLTLLNLSYSGGNATNNYKFKYVETASITIEAVIATIADYESDKPLDDWQNGIIVLTPANSYIQISTDGVNWQNSLIIAAEGGNSVNFRLRKADGTLTDETTIDYKLDNTNPEAEITIKQNSFKTFINTITFGLFFKNNVDLTISGRDALSGVKTVEYQKVAGGDAFDPNDTWTAGTSFSVTANEKFIAYARVTDNAGNVTVVNSEGVVVYTDSAPVTQEISYEKLSLQDKDVTVTLNGNTVASVSVGGTPLTAGQYSVNENIITLKGAYLQTLSAGEHTASVRYNPLGETYKAADGDDAPAETTFKITVTRIGLTAAELTFTSPTNLTYDSAAKIASVIYKISNNAPTLVVSYESGGVSVAEPKDVGEYIVFVSRMQTDDYVAVEKLEVGSFTILAASQSAPDTARGTNPTTLANNDGKIIGVTDAMEYQKQGDSDWMAVDGTEIIDLSDGTYFVRFTEKANYNPGEAAEITLSAFIGTPEAVPAAAFDPRTRTLSETKTGQKYRIDGSEWTDVTSDLSALVNTPCEIELYMPGDDVYTTDSSVQTIIVSQAAKPSPAALAESYEGKNDGKITGVDASMEYRKGNGDWQTVSDAEISGLAPADYFIRVKATAEKLESEAVKITVESGNPEFTERTVSNSDHTVSVSGMVSEDFAITIVPKDVYSDSHKKLLALVDTAKNSVIGAFEVSITGGRYIGKLTLTFTVGSEYNGKTLKVYHETADGQIETLAALCTDGKVIVTVDELSPFMLIAPKAAENNDKSSGTGDNGISIWALFLLVSSGAVLTLGARRRKKTHLAK